jgi:hypothetical protein
MLDQGTPPSVRVCAAECIMNHSRKGESKLSTRQRAYGLEQVADIESRNAKGITAFILVPEGKEHQEVTIQRLYRLGGGSTAAASSSA